MNPGNRLPFPDSVMLTGPINPSSGQNMNSGPMINPIRTEVKKNAPGSLVLPSLNEVIKPILAQDNQAPQMYSPNNMMPYPKNAPFPPSPISSVSNGRGPVPPPPKQQMQPIGALHSLLNPLPPGGKQNLYIVNDRNQIEFERQAMSNYPPMPPPIPASIYPPVNTMHSSVQSYQEQVQEAKRISENLQANVRVYLDPNTKKRKTEQPQQPQQQQQQFAQDPNVNIGAERSAFSPLKKRETTPSASPSIQTATAVATPVPTRSPPSEDMSPSDADGKRDDQSNFAHLLQNNFSGINLTNDSCAELLDIYRNFHKNENAKLTPPPPLSADKDKKNTGNK